MNNISLQEALKLKRQLNIKCSAQDIIDSFEIMTTDEEFEAMERKNRFL